MTPRLVAVLCGRSPAERYSTHRGYVSSVVAVGGVPVVVPCGPDTDPRPVELAVDRCDAVVVTGGGDVDPDLYSGTVDLPAGLMDVDPARDLAEIAAVQYALAQRTRVLGVCRGAQLLAVIGGGTLVPDLVEKGITGHWDEERQHEPVHAVHTESGSLAAQVLGSLRAREFHPPPVGRRPRADVARHGVERRRCRRGGGGSRGARGAVAPGAALPARPAPSGALLVGGGRVTLSQTGRIATTTTAPPAAERKWTQGPVVTVEDLHVTFTRGKQEIYALRGVTLEVMPGEILGLVGESGSGKSVLGLSLLGLLPDRPLPAVTGAALVCGTDMVTATQEEARLVRRQHLGAVFQDPMTSLNPTMRVGRQIGGGGRLERRGAPPPRRGGRARGRSGDCVPTPTSSPAACASGS